MEGPYEQGGIVLDVRSPAEWAQGHIPGALLIPVGELDGRTGEVLQAVGGNRALPIQVMCKRGRRAERAVQILRAAGFTRVTNIGGTEVEPLRTVLGGLRRPTRATLRSWLPRPR
jgi:rhodanese-related sulfurtransferase